MKYQFIEKDFHKETLQTIWQAESIIQDYQDQGYSLTLRQLYYQFVAQDLIPNTKQSYNRLGTIISDARLAGFIDWNAIEDRTRNLESYAAWNSPAHRVSAAANNYQIDMWENQPAYIEVWVEKEALIGVIEQACNNYRVPHIACRGYMSQSEQYRAAQRLSDLHYNGKEVAVIHLGDHDPSGIDMTRDNADRLSFLGECSIDVVRIALNMDQIQEYNPPPNFAKVSDSRAKEYMKKFGSQSWELDALPPKYLDELITSEISKYIDWDIWDQSEEREREEKTQLIKIANDLAA